MYKIYIISSLSRMITEQKGRLRHNKVTSQGVHLSTKPWVFVLSLMQEGRGSGSRLTKLSGSCRATSLSMQSTYADSHTPVIPPAAPRTTRAIATRRAPRWRTARSTASFAPRRAQTESASPAVSSSSERMDNKLCLTSQTRPHHTDCKDVLTLPKLEAFLRRLDDEE